MFSLSKWIKARKEEKANERKETLDSLVSDLIGRYEALAGYAEDLLTYGPEIKEGQQFFDFMFEDETFVKVYKAVLSGEEGVA